MTLSVFMEILIILNILELAYLEFGERGALRHTFIYYLNQLRTLEAVN